jgi:hypothetical protein
VLYSVRSKAEPGKGRKLANPVLGGGGGGSTVNFRNGRQDKEEKFIFNFYIFPLL